MNRQYRYLIAVSGGPDSMALLDMSYKKGYYLEVAHVNYHKRDTAKRDEDTVFLYCQKHNIPFHLLNVYPEDVKGNFQAYARDARYDFFKEICLKNNLEAVLVAHHKDDLIETYLMQTEKNMGVSHYGLRNINHINGIKVLRPLLSKTKKQLLKYCIDNNISYGIDESNDSDDYLRNRIRHNRIELMTLKEKNDLVREIKEKNRQIEAELKEAEKHLSKVEYDVDELLNVPYLRRYLRQYIRHISEAGMDELLRQLKESSSFRYENEEIVLVKEYGIIEMYKPLKPYEYTFNSIEEMYGFKCDAFRLSKKGRSVDGAFISEEDFPVTIRTYRKADSIKMRFGTKKINRFFIDRKIHAHDREKWPLMFNAKNELILVSGLGSDLAHYSKIYNIFMLKL